MQQACKTGCSTLLRQYQNFYTQLALWSCGSDAFRFLDRGLESNGAAMSFSIRNIENVSNRKIGKLQKEPPQGAF